MEKCQDSLSNVVLMNPWYLPTIPTTILTFADVCSAYQDLFSQMNSKGLQSTAKAVQYSLILTLELDFNAKEEKLFNECTDSVVRQDPKKFCMVDIIGLTEFALWTDKEIDSYCTAAATQVVLDCSDGFCTPCADEISFLFTRYANVLDQLTTNLFQLISSYQATVLQNSNAFNSISKQINPYQDKTAGIQLPKNVTAQLQILDGVYAEIEKSQDSQ